MRWLCWWLVEAASRLLSPDEQEVVCGDFAESGESGGQALCHVVGLVARRQAALWTHWRPWLTLAGLVVPVGMLLSVVSRRTADLSSIYIWMYANNWRWGDLRNTGFWHVLAETVSLVFMSNLALVCWSWTSGFVLGSVSRGIFRVNGILFCLTLCFGVLVGAPLYLAYYWHHLLGLSPLPDPNAAVFALTFYRVMFPLIVQAVLVVGPSLWGMRQGRAAARLPPVLRSIFWLVAIAALAVIVIQEPGLGLFLKAYRPPWIWDGWQMRLLRLVVYWPVGYLVAISVQSHWRKKFSEA